MDHKKIFCMVFVLISPLLAQNQNIKQIEIIKKIFQAINSRTDYQVVALKNEEFMDQMTDGGGELKGYLKNGEFCKINEKIFLSSCIQTIEYYLNKGKLIFIYEKDENYVYVDSIGSLDYTRVNLDFEGRYYFENNKLIQNKTSGNRGACSDSPGDLGKTYYERLQNNLKKLEIK